MSDLTTYRDKKRPLVLRMRAAAQDNLEANELDALVEEWATEAQAIGDILHESAKDAAHVLEEGIHDSKDLDNAYAALDDNACSLVGKRT